MYLPKFEEKIAGVSAFYAAEKPRLALDKLKYLERRGVFTPEEEWQLLLCYSNCYYRMFDLDKQLDYLWRSVTTTLGQPLVMQQTNYSDYLMLLHYADNVTDDFMRERHFIYDTLMSTTERLPYDVSRHRHKRLRIGYIADTFAQNVGSLFTLPLFTDYNRDRFEIYCYGLRPWAEDAYLPQFIASHVKKIRAFPRTTPFADIAREIYADEIDILFDLDVHNAGGRTLMVAGYKPAPVQMAGIGYMNTSGLKAMDYFLSDVNLDPPGENDADFAEKLIRLPGSHFCFNDITVGKQPVTVHKTSPHIRFAVFNNFFKITDRMIKAWKEILLAVPDSTLLLKSSMHRTGAVEGVKKKLKTFGLPLDRITVEDASNDYYLAYADTDIILDTFPYTGGTMTCDALYHGVPVVNLRGRRHGTRFGYSLLKNIGLEELSSDTVEGYIKTAVALAGDKELISALHRQIPRRFQNSPIMDKSSYVRQMEQIYEEIWREKNRGGAAPTPPQ